MFYLYIKQLDIVVVSLGTLRNGYHSLKIKVNS